VGPIVVLAILSMAPTAQDPGPAPSLELRVERAIGQGLRWLKGRQARDGSWPGHEDAHPGGVTALCGYTLVKSGVERTDTALIGGLRAISGVSFKSTYSAAVHLLLAAALRDARPPTGTEPAPIVDSRARASFDLLVASQRDGLWGYPSDSIDMSNTQFALLGLRAGKRLGFEAPKIVLERCASALFHQQEESGGFAYTRGNSERGGMTAATLAGFAVIAELSRGDADVLGLLGKKKDRIRAAEAWIDSRYSVARQPFGPRGWTPSWEYEYLWAIERWCGLTGRKKIGEHDWYREGAERLIDLQRAGGDWGDSIENTCFALLFLRRATMTGWEDLSAVYRRLDAEKRAAAEKPVVAPAAGVPRIADWIVAGPYRDEYGNPAFQAMDLAKLRPRERQKFGDRAFERASLKTDDWTNLEQATGRDGDHIDWIVSTSLVWEPPGGGKQELDATLWFAFEDAWKIWLDGKLLSSEMRMASPIQEDVVLPVTLEPGAHTLVVLVADDTGDSAFSGRITDRLGKGLPAGFSVNAGPAPKSGRER
jgi:hypothetical protein